MRMVLIAGILVLVLAGGAGAYFYFIHPAQAAVTGDAAAMQKAAEEAKKDQEAKSKLEFVEMDPLILPIVDNDGVTQVVSLVVAIVVSDAEKKEMVKKLSPLLKDAFIQDLYGELSHQAAMKDGVIQVGNIKERLNKIAIKVLGKDAINQVLLQVVQQRPA